MSVRYSRMYSAPVPKMPPGLIQLMEGLAKDVLKNSPVNIYEFCAQHMQRLIEIRDGKDSESDITISKHQTSVSEGLENEEKNHDSDPTTTVIPKTDKDDVTRNKTETTEQSAIPTEGVSVANNEENKNTEIETSKDASLEDEKTDLNTQSIINNVELSDSVILENKSTETENVSPLADSSEFKDKDIGDERDNVVVLSEDINNVTTDEIKNSSGWDMGCDIESQPMNISEEIDGTEDEQFDDETKSKNLEVNIDLNECSNLEIATNAEEKCNLHEKELKPLLSLDRSIIEATEKNNEQEMSQSTTNNTLASLKTSGIKDFSKESFSSVDNETQNRINNPMDLEKAAITIQKVFRAFLFKSKTLSVDDVTNVDFNFLIGNTDKKESSDGSKENFNKERRSLGITRMDTVLQTVNEEKSLSLSTDDSSTLSSAATIIQAHVRGFLVRSKMPLNQTISTASIMDSDIQSAASLDGDQNLVKNKTILNIRIVPDGSNFMSRDESLITSVDLSLDGSPHYSTNLHPLSYDISERRKQLKREDAVQSVSPPSNNSGKLSEDIESVKELLLNDSNDESKPEKHEKTGDLKKQDDATVHENSEIETNGEYVSKKIQQRADTTSDEADVVTPFTTDGVNAAVNQNNKGKLMHSGEFHDIVLPTMITRNNSSVVREFQNVLVYFLLWNTS